MISGCICIQNANDHSCVILGIEGVPVVGVVVFISYDEDRIDFLVCCGR
jgi:hypothetical protein